MSTRILIVGFGSIGRQHLEFVRKKGYQEVIVCIHNENKVEKIAEQYSVTCISSIDEGISSNPEFAIVCDPTSQHVQTSMRILKADIPVLLEKPITNNFHDLNKITNLVDNCKVPFLVGFQMRHHPHFKIIKQVIKSGELGSPLSLRGCVGQYLPNWRSKSDYRRSSSSISSLGGGVILDLSHEIDIALQIMGNPIEVFSFSDKYSDLDIETEDIADIVMRHEAGQSSIHLNYVERKYMWITTITFSRGSLIWDYGSGKLEKVDESGHKTILGPDLNITRDELFLNQLDYFIKLLDGGKFPKSDLVASINATKVCLMAKKSVDDGTTISFN